MIDAYFGKINEKFMVVLDSERGKMKEAASKIAAAIEKGGIVQLFGCGHSHILTEEVFYRAGGLVPIKPIFHELLMLHEGAMLSSQLERKNHYAHSFMDGQDIRENDVMIVLSTSGRNPVPVDAAQIAKEKGAFVIGITSFEYSNSQPSRHDSGKRLYDAVDIAIDNHSPIGDAVLTHEKVEVPFSPTSTVVGAGILNAIFAEAIALMAEAGFEPPIFLSGNIEGSDDHNKSLVSKYEARIPLLTKGL
ncbi:SIS domain-containing protein [Bacillus sp. FJAT-49711]|uniref:SIS domain-containing protein n=1 Tax=Bacillus sp. FJAT-49711 TaxID=2833585 RepID=UPI001BCA0647|nr:SIS domain-containing protein [Bacillus sp. FJAT-49711]MBS4219186.1 SIS domain-containing protein [Bacillus sp. FJAT-49711]